MKEISQLLHTQTPDHGVLTETMNVCCLSWENKYQLTSAWIDHALSPLCLSSVYPFHQECPSLSFPTIWKTPNLVIVSHDTSPMELSRTVGFFSLCAFKAPCTLSCHACYIYIDEIWVSLFTGLWYPWEQGLNFSICFPSIYQSVHPCVYNVSICKLDKQCPEENYPDYAFVNMPKITKSSWLNLTVIEV